MSERVDVVMLERGLAVSREKARALIMEGNVYVDGVKVTKAGTAVKDDSVIEIRGNVLPFVSRGGLKLLKAVETFPIDLNGAYCLDIGASTGGFTDCMLQHGARHVCAVDVGYGQLDWKLRTDERVTVMERTNARNMEPSWYSEPADFASIDVSFISLRLILPPLFQCLKEGAGVVALIKPQFEAGRSEIGKNGVVRDSAVHARVIREITDFAVKTAGFALNGLTYSPITGPKGNIEYLMYLRVGGESREYTDDEIQAIVQESHQLTAVHE